MQIERIFYPVLTLGYGKRIGIWTIGCPHGCLNCSNPELWDTNPSKDISLDQIFAMISSISQPIDGVTITGGDPFEQIEEFAKLVHFIKTNITDDILIYSGYSMEELRSRRDVRIDLILEDIAVLIDGTYIEELNDNGPLRGSSNQVFHILNPKYESRYELLLKEKRKVQTVFYQRDLLTIGIPVKQYRIRMKKEFLKQGIQMKG